MAKTKDGNKIVSVRPYTRKGPNGNLIKVSGHKRSTPN
jgi:hypothetical protein